MAFSIEVGPVAEHLWKASRRRLSVQAWQSGMRFIALRQPAAQFFVNATRQGVELFQLGAGEALPVGVLAPSAAIAAGIHGLPIYCARCKPRSKLKEDGIQRRIGKTDSLKAKEMRQECLRKCDKFHFECSHVFLS